jgi:hypothetical protein
MKDGKAKYVTAVCRSDTIDGWRDRRQDGGVVIDVESGEIVCEGLSKPRSQRFDGLVTELFDVTFLDDVKCPMALGQQSPENLSLISVESGLGQEVAGAGR